MVKGYLQSWQKKINVSMVGVFIAYGNNIFRPCFDYYHKQIMDPDEYLYRLRRYTISAQVFDTFMLRRDIIDMLCPLADELVHFVYDKYLTQILFQA